MSWMIWKYFELLHLKISETPGQDLPLAWFPWTVGERGASKVKRWRWLDGPAKRWKTMQSVGDAVGDLFQKDISYEVSNISDERI